MRRPIRMLLLAVVAVVAAATVADAIRHETFAPIWEMAWLPAVVAGALCGANERRCQRTS